MVSSVGLAVAATMLLWGVGVVGKHLISFELRLNLGSPPQGRMKEEGLSSSTLTEKTAQRTSKRLSRRSMLHKTGNHLKPWSVRCPILVALYSGWGLGSRWTLLLWEWWRFPLCESVVFKFQVTRVAQKPSYNRFIFLFQDQEIDNWLTECWHESADSWKRPRCLS